DPDADEETPRRGTHAGAARGEPSAAPAPTADRACQQQCQALSHRQRSAPFVEEGRPRSGDGNLLCLAQLPGASHALATNGLIGINSDELGFVPFERTGGELLFNILAERHGQRSTVITSNLAF